MDRTLKPSSPPSAPAPIQGGSDAWGVSAAEFEKILHIADDPKSGPPPGLEPLRLKRGSEAMLFHNAGR
jgi:hypothetical protein